MRFLISVWTLFVALTISAAPSANAVPNPNISDWWTIWDHKGREIDRWFITPGCPDVMVRGCILNVVANSGFYGNATWAMNYDWVMTVQGPLPICGPNGDMAEGVLVFRFNTKRLDGNVFRSASGPCPSGQIPKPKQHRFVLTPSN